MQRNAAVEAFDFKTSPRSVLLFTQKCKQPNHLNKFPPDERYAEEKKSANELIGNLVENYRAQKAHKIDLLFRF